MKALTRSLAFRKSAALIAKGEERAAELLAQANLNAEAARQRLAIDVKDIETYNAESNVFNERAGEALTVALDAPRGLGDDEDAWRSWYYDLIGYRYTPPPKVMVAQNGTLDLPTPVIVSCFAAGTPIPTREGTKAIESIRTGDQVLSQDVTSGALAFRTVMAVHHNPPDKTLRVVTRQRRRSRGQPLPSVLARRHRLGDGPRPEAGPNRPHAFRARPRAQGRSGPRPTRFQSRCRRGAHLLRRKVRNAGAR